MTWNLKTVRSKFSPSRHRTIRSRKHFRPAAPALEWLEPRLAPSADVLSWRGSIPGNNSGVNANETQLTPAKVNFLTFGQLFNNPVDGTIYGEPLVKTGVNINGVLHNVVFVATEHDSVYAFDADAAGPALWHDSFLTSGLPGATSITPVPNGVTQSGDIAPEIGISNTMFIDAGTGTLFTTAKTQETVSGVNHYVIRLHALDLATGAEKFGGPVTIGDTTIGGPDGGYTDNTNVSIPGTGAGSNGTVVKFNALRENERDGLFEDPSTGLLYLTFTSHGDVEPTHGWMLGYDPQTLQLKSVFNTAPNGFDTAIWMGEGMSAMDANGIIYNATGNGLFDVFSSPAPGPKALGPGGGGLGYGPDTPGSNTGGILNSMAVKFDLFNNAGEGTDSTGVFTNGRSPTVRQSGLDPSFPDTTVDMSASPIQLHSGHHFRATLAYDNSAHTLMETITDLDIAAPNTFTQTYTNVNLTSLLAGNTGYVGFTGGTGGLTATQNVNTWTLSTPGGGTVVNFAGGFGTPTNLTNNGSAKFTGGAAQLTDGGGSEAGSVFYNTAVDVSGNFTTTFTFQITPASPNTADGFTFTIQNSPATAAGPDYAESVLRIDPTQTSPNANSTGVNGGPSMKVVDSFTPSDQQALSNADLDQGSGGVLLLPDSVGSAAHPHLMVQTGKEGEVYLIDRDKLGGYNTNPNGPDNVVQVLPPGTVAGGAYSTPAYFNGKIYYMGAGDVLKAFSIANGMINPTPVAQTDLVFGFTGASPFITTDPNGNNAIVWVLDNHLHGTNGAANGPSVLHAYDANTLTELYNSSQFGTLDQLGGAVKFSVPTVANGKVYVPTQTGVYVFGLLSTPRTQPPVLQVHACSSEADLQWTATANDHYVILQSTDGTNFATIATVNSSVTTFSVTNLSPNKYFFQVEAFNKNSTPAFSNIVHAFVGEPAIIDETPNFAGHSDLTANGSARFFDAGPPFGIVALLTDGGGSEAGSMFSNPKLDIRGFTTTFTFALLNGTNPSADGMTFIIQGNSPTSLGAGGGGLGYFGIPNSVAIKFDLFNNEGEGSNSTGIFFNGDFPGLPHAPGEQSIDLTSSGIDLHSQHIFLGTLAYDGSTLTETIVDTSTGKTFTHAYTNVNIPSLVGGDTAFVGFGAGTGGLTTIAAVGSWKYTPTTGNLPPLAPSNLAVVNVTTHDANRDDVALTWFCNSYNETGFAVQRSTDGVHFSTVATLPANTTSYTDVKVDPGLTYYRVYAFNGNGNSLFSNVDSVLLGAPRETTTVDHSGGFTSHGDLTANGNATFAGFVYKLDDGSSEENFNNSQGVETEDNWVANSFQVAAGTQTLLSISFLLSGNYTNRAITALIYTGTSLADPHAGSGLTLVSQTDTTFSGTNGSFVTIPLAAPVTLPVGQVYWAALLMRGVPGNQFPFNEDRDNPLGRSWFDVGPTQGGTYNVNNTSNARVFGATDHPVVPGGVQDKGNLMLRVNATGTAQPLVARLTDGGTGEAGSVFTTSRVLVSNFDTTFTFRMHDGTNPSADGMAFVIQASSPQALGFPGGGLGYGLDHPGGALGIPNSIAIKFDLFNNAGEGNNSTGIFFNGDSPTIPSQPGEASIDLTSSGIDLHSQDVFKVHLTYDGTTLIETIVDTSTGKTFTHSYAVNIPALIGGDVAYAGFTGGTGGLTTIADVQTWTYQFVEPKPGQPQLAAGGPAATGGAAALTAAELAPVALEAVARWAAAGLDAAGLEKLNEVQYQIVTLGNGALGWASLGGLVVSLDATAAGYGWDVDPNSPDDTAFGNLVAPAEFQAPAGSPAFGRMDLLTVVEHELGHVLGMSDLDSQTVAHDLMTETLATGIRRVATPADVMTATATTGVSPAGASVAGDSGLVRTGGALGGTTSNGQPIKTNGVASLDSDVIDLAIGSASAANAPAGLAGFSSQSTGTAAGILDPTLLNGYALAVTEGAPTGAFTWNQLTVASGTPALVVGTAGSTDAAFGASTAPSTPDGGGGGLVAQTPGQRPVADIGALDQVFGSAELGQDVASL
jgi:hypothetical protein